jgi:hypothetical protein
MLRGCVTDRQVEHLVEVAVIQESAPVDRQRGTALPKKRLYA